MVNKSLHTAVSNAKFTNKKNTVNRSSEEIAARAIKINAVFDKAEVFFELKAGTILSKSRKRDIAHPRFMVYFYLKGSGYQPTEISRALGINHTSVLHGLTAISGFFDVYDDYKNKYVNLKDFLDA